MDLFELVGRIAIKNSDAIRELDNTSKKGQETESKLSKTFSTVGKGAVAVGKVVGTSLVAAGAAMGGLTIKAMNMAGELEQNMGGSEAVFGEYATKMQDKAQEAFSNMGLSTSDYLATANKMGALFQGAGFSIEESMDISSGAMQRAADVASIMGIDTSAAMEAIAGAAKGNFTMMDNLGVAMNDTTLQAYALEKGINKSTSEMTNQEKIGLAMEMFMDKTAYAAGNYAKENETLAGSLGTAKAALTNFLDGSGDVDQLVTAFSNAADVIIKNVGEIAPRLVSGLVDLVNQVAPMIPDLLNQLLPTVIEGAVGLVNGLVAALPGVISALMGALPALIDGVMQIMNALIAALPQLMETLIGALPALIPQLVNGLVSMIVMLCTMLPQIIQPIIAYLPQIIITLVNALMQNLPALIQGCVQLVVGIVQALPQIILALLNALPTIIVSVVNGLLAALPTLIQGVGQIVTSVVSAVWEFLSGFPAAVTNYTTTMWNNISNVISGVWEAIKTTVATLIQTIVTNIATAWRGIWNTLTGIVNGIWTTISTAFTGVWNTVTNIWQKIKKAIQDPIESAKELVKKAIDAIKGFFSFEIKWPHIPMPHFSINPSGWKIGDLLKGSIPSLGIDWYAKAMDNPMVMTDPTIFGYNPSTGSLMGGGEAGSEMVGGTNTIMRMIGEAVAANSNAQTEKLIKVMTAVLNAIVSGNADMIDALLAGHVIKLNERELGRTVRQYA